MAILSGLTISGGGITIYGAGNIPAANDPYFMYNTMLLMGTSTTFVDDASTNNFAVTIFGDTKPNSSNPYSPGYYSNYFDGTGDYLTVPNNTATNLSTGDFTIEFWLNASVTQAASNPRLLSTDTWNTTAGYDIAIESSQIIFRSGGGTGKSCTFTTGDYGIWQHIAFTRSGTSFNVFKNGVLANTYTDSSNLTSANPTYIAKYAVASGNEFTGYISNLRIVKGTAVYTAAFTPPTAPLTAIANTSLLSCQSNRFIDNSTNNFTITVAGNTTINSFEPFIPNSSYSSYGSGYFDGTGDYLSVADNVALQFGTGNFTIEMWVYLNTVSGVHGFLSKGLNSVGWSIVQSGTTLYFEYGATNITSSTTLVANKWTHVAVVRSGTGASQTVIYVDGVSAGTGTVSTNFNDTNALVIGEYRQAGYTINAYVTDVRLVKGTAVYTANFTPPTAPLTAISGTSLLVLQNNQSVNNSTFLDNSTNNFLVTRNGNATQGTFSPYGGNWSNYFDGSGDYLTLPNNAVFSQTGSWTLELWVYPTVAVNNYVYSQATANFLQINIDGANYVNIDRSGVGNLIVSTNPILLNMWTHIALVSDGTNMKLFINGSQSGSTASVGTQASSATTTRIGAYQATGTLAYQGYISNLRLVKGSALYTTTFIPSTTPLTAVNGTGLLTCQSSRVIDNSINNFTITLNGNTSIQRFSPFDPSSVTPTSYSGYFDGTGDYLSVPASTAFAFGTGDYTFELWVYSAIAYSGVICLYNNNSGGYFLQYNTGTGLQTGVTGSSATGTYSTTLTANTWNHIAVSRASGSSKCFVNGTQVGTTVTDNTNYAQNGAYIGALYNGDQPLTGYISNLRVVKGTAVYTSNFTPSTTPLTAISGTSLLTLQSPTFIDNSTNNFAITAVGNSQPTIQNPFGYTSTTTEGYTVSTIGGSGYFDRTASNQYLTLPDSTFWALGTTATIELWYYPVQSPDISRLISIPGVASGAAIDIYDTAGQIGAFNQGYGPAIKINQWTHIAVVLISGTWSLYYNGVKQTVTGGNTGCNITSTGNLWIGAISGYGQYTGGYLSDIRITKGSAVYTSNFVPPSSPLLATQNTVALLNMTNAGIYDASMMNDLENVGDAKLSTAVSKFGGSSMSFDGTGDYLSMSTTQLMNFGTGDFTVETWVYPNSLSSDWFIASATGSGGFFFGFSSTTTVGYGWGRNGIAWDYRVASTATAGTWQHLAITRSGTSMRMFVNGTQVGTTQTISTAYDMGTTSTTVGSQGAAYYLNGYIDDLRITKGYARYTSNFTAPTEAFPTY